MKDINCVAGPVHRVDTTAVLIEARAIGPWFPLHRTANSARAVGAALVAGPGLLVGGSVESTNAGFSLSVHGSEVGVDVVEALDDIDFAIWGIVFSDRPAFSKSVIGISFHGRWKRTMLAIARKRSQAYEQNHQ